MHIESKQVDQIEMEAIIRLFEYNLDKVKKQTKYITEPGYSSYAARIVNVWLMPLINSGVSLSQAVLGTKEIPSGQSKKLEMAIRVFMAVSAAPTKPVEWFNKNLPLIEFLLGATKWKDKSDESEQKFNVGPFTVHNTMGLTGDSLEAVKTAIDKVIVLLKGSRVPDIEHVLYGDIMVVGKLKAGTTIAWYYGSEDTVYMRPFTNAGFDEIHSLVHELGHRYIHKMIDKGVYRNWVSYHSNIMYTGSKVEIPQVGDTLPFVVKGLGKEKPTVKRIVGDRFYLTETSYMTYSQVKGAITELSVYPTPYSAKSPDEHLCEALAHRVMGKLKEPNLSRFKEILEGEKAMPLSITSATTYAQISRDDLEAWLNSMPLHDRAYRVPNKAGVYILPFSDAVGCKLLSTIGTSDDAMGRGMASMQLALVSRITGNVLNKKAQGQTHFARTTNWRKNWKEGVDRIREAYTKSQGFYDAIASIEDRVAYKRDILKDIEAFPNWVNNDVLSGFHSQVKNDGVLTMKQMGLMIKILSSRAEEKPPAPVQTEDQMLPVLRTLYTRARSDGNQWLMDFTKSLAEQIKSGRPLTPRQLEVVDKNKATYKMSGLVGTVSEMYLNGVTFS